MNKPYMGKILMVDLSSRTMTEEEIPDRVYEQYLSGMGLGAYILYNRMPAGADPLGPDNILGFLFRISHGNRQPVLRPLDACGEIAADRMLGRRKLRRHFFTGHQTLRL